MNNYLLFIHFIHIILLSSLSIYVKNYIKSIDDYKVVPFTNHYYLFKDSFPPTKIFIYNKTHPRFQKHLDTLFDPDTDKRFNTHSYVPDVFIFQNIYRLNYVTQDPEQADVFFLRFLCSRYDWGFHYFELYPIMESQGNYYQRYGGVDHFFLHTTHSIFYSVIRDEDHMHISNMFTTQMLHWNETLMYPRIMMRITSSPVYSNLPVSKVNKKRDISVLLLAGVDVHEPSISVLRLNLIDAFKNISSTKIIVTYRYKGSQMEYKQRYSKFMEKSQICIIPAGDCYNSKRFFDSMKKLCVPFIFSDEFRFPFESLFLNYEKLIVQQPMFEYQKIHHNLMLLNSRKIKEMRESLHSISKIYEAKTHEDASPGNYVWTWFWTQYFQLCYIAAAKRICLL
ncbi:Exostosin family protein [Tritrichomonas foetus]|uniref:Exostosin family protein n=1 Tax=Tritrichomonas foetus TaxID=1144522 RepID=A0A1J4JF36_9EUKA|nr:Exostosin family protein [Tritrichomonas foetus]|eukprot:OHS96259.1 Exostosin family protein [Tritrichomonas foetus]